MRCIHKVKFLSEAEKRLNDLRTIAEDLDLGNGITVPAFTQKIDTYKSIKDNFNFLISFLKGERLRLNIMEKEIRAFGERSLLGVAAKYGRYSPEYAMAGGKIRTRRKRIVRVMNGD